MLRQNQWKAMPLLGSIVLVSGQSTSSMEWIAKSPCPISGVHHPITFANETHGFLLTGSTYETTASSEFYMYDENSDEWTDLTATSSSFPGAARSFGYGVVLAESRSTKAYVGFGAAEDGERLADLWEFDMATHGWRRLPDCPGLGRRHPALVSVRDGATGSWQIHVGLGDTYDGGSFFNLDDWWSLDIASESWERMPDLPSSPRHHPFYFGLGNTSYAGFGHSRSGIERDWFSLSTGTSNDDGAWVQEPSMASYDVISDDNGGVTSLSDVPVTTEARVAGTQFSIELPLVQDDGSEPRLSGSLGFVLSGDGDDHGPMLTGEFHAFYPAGNKLLDGPDGPESSWWRQLNPHPGLSRWAPGSFVMRGSARAYFTGGYDRVNEVLNRDLWMIDLSPLFVSSEDDSEAQDVDGGVLDFVGDEEEAAADGSKDDVEEDGGTEQLSTGDVEEDPTSGSLRFDLKKATAITCGLFSVAVSLF